MAVRSLAVESEFSKYLVRWSRDLKVLRQNWLLSESAFLSFARDRGIKASGIVIGEPSEFHERGWLSADARIDKNLEFHPFRLHVLHQALSHKHVDSVRAREWNGTADLSILLEPIYWPQIVGHVRGSLGDTQKRQSARYRLKVLKLVRSLDPGVWKKVHEGLRIDAAGMDQNGQLYALLRLSPWEQRERLHGQISGALWIRHMAEVIRRGFEEAHETQWKEEDQEFGYYAAGGRVRLFGSERPFDDPMHAKPFLAYRFGLFTGSAVRWYVEGDTEYYAFLQILQEPSKLGVELVNLRSEVKEDKANAARKLEDALKEDLALRRFSVISFDRDVKANERAIRRQIEQDHIVGEINANKPDFEFANFSLEELVEIAALMDDQLNCDGGKVRKAEWKGIASGKALSESYQKSSERRVSLKGKAWGEALAKYAIANPINPQTGTQRRLLRVASAAAWGWRSNYNSQKEDFTFDIKTFEAKPR